MTISHLPREVHQIITSFVETPHVLMNCYESCPFIGLSIHDTSWKNTLMNNLPVQYRSPYQVKFNFDKRYGPKNYVRLVTRRRCTFCNSRTTIPYLNLQVRLCGDCLDHHCFNEIPRPFDHSLYYAQFSKQYDRLPTFDRGEITKDPRVISSMLRYSTEEYIEQSDIYFDMKTTPPLRMARVRHAEMKRLYATAREGVMESVYDRFEFDAGLNLSFDEKIARRVQRKDVKIALESHKKEIEPREIELERIPSRSLGRGARRRV